MTSLMPNPIRFLLFILTLGLTLWISLWLFVVFFALALIMFVCLQIRQLFAKDHPSPPQDSSHPTIIEGEYERIDTP